MSKSVDNELGSWIHIAKSHPKNNNNRCLFEFYFLWMWKDATFKWHWTVIIMVMLIFIHVNIWVEGKRKSSLQSQILIRVWPNCQWNSSKYHTNSIASLRKCWVQITMMQNEKKSNLIFLHNVIISFSLHFALASYTTTMPLSFPFHSL